MEDVSSIVGEVEELVKGCATALLDRCAPDVDLYCRCRGSPPDMELLQGGGGGGGRRQAGGRG